MILLRDVRYAICMWNNITRGVLAAVHPWDLNQRELESIVVFFRIMLEGFGMEWKFVAVRPETKETLDRLTAIDGKFSGYKKNELIQMALDILDKV